MANSRSDNRRFRRGRGVYVCCDCGKRTRDTGQGEESTDLCLACLRDAERENYHSDNSHGRDIDPKVCSQCKEDLG